MIKTVLFCLLLSLETFAYGQNKMAAFKADFEKALDKNFSEDRLNTMFRDYSDLLTPHSDAARLFETIQGHEVSMYPLFNFKDEKLYADNMGNLLNSKNPNQRILAYLVIASSYDTTKESILLDKIKTEKDKGCLTWAGMASATLICFQCIFNLIKILYNKQPIPG